MKHVSILYIYININLLYGIFNIKRLLQKEEKDNLFITASFDHFGCDPPFLQVLKWMASQRYYKPRRHIWQGHIGRWCIWLLVITYIVQQGFQNWYSKYIRIIKLQCTLLIHIGSIGVLSYLNTTWIDLWIPIWVGDIKLSWQGSGT